MATRKKKAAGKKVAKRGGRRPGAGRPKGSRSVLPQGSARPLKLLSGLPPEALDIPQVKKALDTITKVMEGRITGRHVQTRLQACTQVIEFFAGKPKQRNEHDLGPSLAELLAKASQRELPESTS